MKQVTAVVLSLVLTAIAFAEPQATGAGKTKSTRKKSTNVSAELQQLRQALEAQQLQIQQLSDELKSRDQALQQMQQRLDQSQAVATQAQSKADVAASPSAPAGWLEKPRHPPCSEPGGRNPGTEQGGCRGFSSQPAGADGHRSEKRCD